MENLSAYITILISALITAIIVGLVLWGWYSFVYIVSNKNCIKRDKINTPCEKCYFADSCQAKIKNEPVDTKE